MLAEEYKILFLSSMSSSCLQTEITQKPTLHKHFNVISRFMRVQTFFVVSLFTNLIMSCSQESKTESGKVEIKEVTLYDIVDDVEPPPPNFTSNFKTLQDWLFTICDDEKPEKSILNYNFGLFESSDDNIIYLVGVNKYDKGDTSHTRIEFEPSNMYFQLPNSEYQNLGRDQILNKLTAQLKAFTNTEKFQNSFLAKANAIILESSGQTIWSK